MYFVHTHAIVYTHQICQATGPLTQGDAVSQPSYQAMWGLASVPASKPISQTLVPAREGGSWPPRAPVARKQLSLIVYVEHACVCLWLSEGQNSPCGDREIMLKSMLKMKEVPNGTLDCRCSPCCGACHLQKQDHSRAS